MKYSNISNNAWPLADGRCCDDCNSKVILARLKVYLDEMMVEENKSCPKEENRLVPLHIFRQN